MMPPVDDKRVWQLVADCLDLAPEDRDAHLSQSCSNDPRCRAEVETLLDLYQQMGDAFLQEPLILEPPDDEPWSQALADGAEVSGTSTYRIVGLLGRGGMGEVYLAHRTTGTYDQRLALKVVRPDRASPRLLEAFEREQRILAELASPNVVHIYGSGRHVDGSPFLVMELVDGGVPIATYCRKHNLSRREMLSLFAVVAEALGKAHDKTPDWIVHADIKPTHLLVGNGGQIKIIDFGAGVLGELGEPVARTKMFASPQQLDGQRPVPADDVYALGKVLKRLLKAIRARRGRRELLLERELNAIVERCVAVDREGRYASSTLLAADLQALLEWKPVSVYRGGLLHRMQKWSIRQPGYAMAARALIVASLVVAGWSWFDSPEVQALRMATAAREQLTKEPQRSLRLAYAASLVSDSPEVLDALRHGVGNRLRNVLRVPRGTVASLAFSSDSQLVAAGTYEHEVSLFSLDTETPVWSLTTGLTERFRARFIENDKRLEVTTERGGVCILDVANGTVLSCSPPPSNRSGQPVRESSDGLLALVAQDSRLRVWDRTKQRWAFDTPVEGDVVGSDIGDQSYGTIAFAPFSHRAVAVTANDRRPSALVNADTNAVVRWLKGPRQWTDVVFSDNGLFVGGMGEDEIYAWDMTSGEQVFRVASVSIGKALAINATGDTFAVSTGDRTVRIWKIPRPTRIEEPANSFGRVAFDETGRYLVAKGNRTTVWNVATGESLLTTTTRGAMTSVTAASFDKARQRLVVDDDRDGLQIWDLRQRVVVKRCCQHPSTIEHVLYSPDGAFIVTQLSLEGREDVFVWDAQSGAMLRHLTGTKSKDLGLAPPRPWVSPDSPIVVVVIQGQMRIEALGAAASREPLVMNDDNEPLFTRFAFSPNGLVAATLRERRTISATLQVAHIDRPHVRVIAPQSGFIEEVTFSSSGRILAAMLDFTLPVWNTQTGALLSTIRMDRTAMFWRFTVSADDRFVSANYSSEIEWRAPRVGVWNIQTGDQMFDVPGLASAISPDGLWVAVVSDGGRLRWYETPELGGDVQKLRAYAAKRLTEMTARPAAR